MMKKNPRKELYYTDTKARIGTMAAGLWLMTITAAGFITSANKNNPTVLTITWLTTAAITIGIFGLIKLGFFCAKANEPNFFNENNAKKFNDDTTDDTQLIDYQTTRV